MELTEKSTQCPKSALEMTTAIVAFCRSLTDDVEFMRRSISLASDVILADYWAEKELARQSSR